MASDVVKASTVTTVNGKSLAIKAGQSVTVDQATVVATDIVCKNGVIHVIDEVVLP
jgi:uncharacterized surface protein with fasciclin (FAS1) repeats